MLCMQKPGSMAPRVDMHWKRAVVRTESKNFIDWTKPRLIIWPDEFDSINDLAETDRTAGGGGSDGVQLHSGPAFYYNDLYFSMLQVMDSGGTGKHADRTGIKQRWIQLETTFQKHLVYSASGKQKTF